MSFTDGVPDAPPADRLRAYSTTSYDDQGRAYQTNTYSVDQADGSISTGSSAGATMSGK